MTLREAYAMLDSIKPDDDTPWRANPVMTLAQAKEIVLAGLPTMEGRRDNPRGPDDPIGPIAEKRVYQVCRNQSRPRY